MSAEVVSPTWWPPPDNEPIGEERARELVAYIKQRAKPILELAHAEIQARHAGEEVTVSGVPAAVLARMSLDRRMTCICIGTLYVGTTDQIPIQLDRTGKILARLSKPADPIAKWISG